MERSRKLKINIFTKKLNSTDVLFLMLVMGTIPIHIGFVLLITPNHIQDFSLALIIHFLWLVQNINQIISNDIKYSDNSTYFFSKKSNGSRLLSHLSKLISPYKSKAGRLNLFTSIFIGITLFLPSFYIISEYEYQKTQYLISLGIWALVLIVCYIINLRYHE